MMKFMKTVSDWAANVYHHEMMNPQEGRFHDMVDVELGLDMD